MVDAIGLFNNTRRVDINEIPNMNIYYTRIKETNSIQGFYSFIYAYRWLHRTFAIKIIVNILHKANNNNNKYNI